MLVEIRGYNLKPGTRDEFHRLMADAAVPLLQRWDVDVVAYGGCPYDENAYYLIRAYPSLAARQQSQDAFYGSAEWRRGPRANILAAIVSYTSTLLELDERTVHGLRAARPQTV